MRIDLLFPTFPPKLDGIGDHTSHLAEALAEKGCTVRVLTAQEDWVSPSRVDVRTAFHLETRRGIMQAVDAMEAAPPDWLIVQFEQISYGRWGLNPFLPLALYRLRRKVPQVNISVMFHEDYMPVSSFKFAVMTTWQRLQFWMLGRLADVAFFSTEPRARKYESWFPETPVHHLPVGSNIPFGHYDTMKERSHIGIGTDDFIIGLFGSAHPSRLLSHVNAAASTCAGDMENCTVLYVGPDGDEVRGVLDRVPVYDAGPLSSEEVSRHFATMDLYLAPFENGVSARRGSFLTGLQHGVPTITTCGSETGPFLGSQASTSFVAPPSNNQELFVRRVEELAHSSDARHTVGSNGQKLYKEHFSWPTIADTVLRTLPTR
jgi:glycosyltransferase involved in cell wall biosynthesis